MKPGQKTLVLFGSVQAFVYCLRLIYIVNEEGVLTPFACCELEKVCYNFGCTKFMPSEASIENFTHVFKISKHVSF
jgi:hypothetical protein